MHFSLHSPTAEYPAPAVFLDRDGTINIERNYLHRKEDWEWIYGAKESIKLLREAGFMVVVVSNQAGIARGMYSSADVEKLHAFVQAELASVGTMIDAFFYCPHHPDFDGVCSCRKPLPLMIQSAASKLNLNLKRSWMIGDKCIDVQAGESAGAKGLLVRTGYGDTEESGLSNAAKVFNSLPAAVHFILEKAVTRRVE